MKAEFSGKVSGLVSYHHSSMVSVTAHLTGKVGGETHTMVLSVGVPQADLPAFGDYVHAVVTIDKEPPA